MAAGFAQNAYTTCPLSPEDETMMQALHDKWGHPSNSKFIQIYRAQNRVGFPTNFLALLNRFRCKVCALCKGARGYRRSTHLANIKTIGNFLQTGALNPRERLGYIQAGVGFPGIVVPLFIASEKYTRYTVVS